MARLMLYFINELKRRCAMRKLLIVVLGLGLLLGAGTTFAGGPRHGGGGYRGGWGGYHGRWGGYHDGWRGYHGGWGGHHGYWGGGWDGYYGGQGWYGRGWQAPYIVNSALNAGLAAYAIHEVSQNWDGGYYGGYAYPGYYSAPAYSYPSYYSPPCYAPSVSYEPVGSQIVTETVTVVE